MEIDLKLHRRSITQLDEIQDKIKERVSFLQLFRFASKSQITLMVIGGILSACMGVTFPALSTFLGGSIDSFGLESQRLEEARKNLFNMIYLGAGALVGGSIMFTFWNITGQKQAIKCRKEFFRSLIKQEMGWLDTQNIAELVNAFTVDVLTFQQAIGEKISTLIMIASMLLAGLCLSFYNGWILSSVLLPAIIILLIAWAKHVYNLHTIFQEQDEIFSASDCKAQESLGAIKLVKAMNGQKFQSLIQENILKEVQNKYQANGKTGALGAFFSMLTMYLMLTLTAWYGSECVFDTEKCPSSLSRVPYTTGIVFQIFYSLLFPAISLNQLTPCLKKISEALTAAARIYAIIDRIPSIKSKENAVKPTQFKGIFRFQNVSFAYPISKGKLILDDLTFAFDCKHSSLVGKSGCGKSTIFQLIMRFYDPDQGIISLDGVDLRDLDLEWLRNQIGYIRQEPTLFATSIRQNLLLAKSDASEEDLSEALVQAQAFSFVQALPDKLSTYVGSQGSQLSGGQRQRIAIARAILKKPKVLLMDEATSALDRANEDLILNNLQEISNDYMTINVTHHQGMLSKSDKIYCLTEPSRITIVQSSSKLQQIINNNQNDHKRNGNFNNFAQLKKMQSIDRQQSYQEPSKAMNIKEQDMLGLQSINHLNRDQPTINKKSQQPEESLNFLQLLTDHKTLFILSCIAAAIDGLAFPSIGLLLGKVLVNVIQYRLDPPYYQNEVVKYCLIMLGISFAGALVEGLTAISCSTLSGRVVRELRFKIQSKLLRLPVSFFETQEHQYEKMIAKLTTSCKAIHSLLNLEIPILISIAICIVYSIAGGIFLDWRTGLTSLGLIPLIVLSQAIQFAFIQGFATQKSAIYESSSQMLSQCIGNMKTVLTAGTWDSFTGRFDSNLDKIDQQLQRKSAVSGIMYGLSYFIQFTTFGLIIFFSALFVNQYQVSMQDSLCSVSLILFGCVSAGGKSIFLQDLAGIKEAVGWTSIILAWKDEDELRAESGCKMLRTAIRGNIQFQGVGFKYENRQAQVLQDLNLQIKQGEHIAIVGPSGCGKSTIISLLLGFYTPTSGKILIEGIDVQDYDLHHLREAFGLVSQEPFIFDQTIQSNITYNKPQATMQQVQKAAEAANFNPLKELQGNMLGFETIVGPKGSHVSGGQKQRIAIARAILRNPLIYLLDEVTSALDYHNQIEVLNSLENITNNKTTITITHNVDMIKPNTRVCRINNGKIQEQKRNYLTNITSMTGKPVNKQTNNNSS